MYENRIFKRDACNEVTYRSFRDKRSETRATAGADQTKMKISPENAADLQTINFDDVADILTAAGAKGKSLTSSSGMEAVADAVNNIKEMTSAKQSLDKEKAERQTGKKDSIECPHCSAIIHKETRQDASGDGYKHPK